MSKKIKFPFNNNDYVKIIDTYSNRRRRAFTSKDNFTRDNSWEICYERFYDAHLLKVKGKNIDSNLMDYLALNLAFYLASWGMYRGSSFMLQYDYRILIPVVEIVLDGKYEDLWEPNFAKKLSSSLPCLSGLIVDLFKKINSCLINKWKYFKGINVNSNKNNGKNYWVSRTLITKIILGTIGCFPAIDTYVGNVLCSPFSDNETFYKNISNSIIMMLNFAKDNFADVSSKKLYISGSTLEYPLMKMYDIYLFQIGKQKSFIKDLVNYINNKVSKSSEIYKNAKPYINKNIKIEDEVVILDEYKKKLNTKNLKDYLDNIKEKYKSKTKEEDEN